MGFKMKVYIMIGLIGSGKSSWAKMTAGADFNTIRVSLDDIRDMIKDRYIFDYQLEPLVREMGRAMALAALEDGKNVIIDDCNLIREHRLELCRLIKLKFSDVEFRYVHVQCQPEVALERRLANLRGQSKFTWEQVMEKMVAAFDDDLQVDGSYLRDELGSELSITKVNNNG
jgi:predicted kinase